MKERHKSIILHSVSAILFLFVLLAIIEQVRLRQYMNLLWLCYFNMALISIGIIAKKPNLILSQILILMIPDLLWIFDFFGILVTGTPVLGTARYFFAGNRDLLSQILSVQHLFTIPLSLLVLSLVKIKKSYKALFISFIEITLFFVLSYFIPGNYGVNCLPTSEICTSLQMPKFIPYPLFWFAVEFSFIIVSYFIVAFLLFIKRIIFVQSVYYAQQKN